MRNSIQTLISLALVACAMTNSSAQTWRSHKAGIPSGFGAKTVYGEGTSITTTNNSSFSTDDQLYYTPDSSTVYTGIGTSAFGLYTGMETPIVKCHGILFEGTSNGVYKSHNNGHTWTATSMTQIAYALYVINDTLYASIGAGLGVPQMSTDTGNTWTTIGYTGALSVSFLKYNGVLYVGSTNGLKYTNDNGATWNTVSAPAGITAVSIVDIVALNGSVYAACSTGVYKSINNGSTWTNVLAQDMFCLSAIDTSLLGGTAQNGIFQSSQDGTHWTQINTGLPYVGVSAYLTISHITYNDNYIIALAGGDSVIYVTDPAGLGLHPASTPTIVQPSLKQDMDCAVMPNPAANEIAVQINNGAANDVTISLYDITGRRLKTITYTNQNIKFDLADIAAGTYFLHITQGSEHSVKKIVVIK